MDITREYLGISSMAFVVIIFLSVIISMWLFGDNDSAVVSAIIGSFGTAWLYGKLGPLFIILLILVTVGFGIWFIVSRRIGGGFFRSSLSQPLSAVTRVPRESLSSSDLKSAPSKLFHGTPNLRSAIDIVRHNRWRLRSHSPNGIYMSENFRTAAGYAGGSGAVVEINVFISPSMIVDIDSMQGTSKQIVAMGYRLIRDGDIYIAPTPESKGHGKYFRVEGLIPVRLLDSKGKPISHLTV